jgi:hypothetical protein
VPRPSQVSSKPSATITAGGRRTTNSSIPLTAGPVGGSCTAPGTGHRQPSAGGR